MSVSQSASQSASQIISRHSGLISVPLSGSQEASKQENLGD